jgi:hypothetical protein
MNAEQVAKIFGCTVEQARAQYLANAASLRNDAAKAARTGKKVRGYTEAQCIAAAEKMEKAANPME